MRRATQAIATAVVSTALSCTVLAATGEFPDPIGHWTAEQRTAAGWRLARFELFTGCEPIPAIVNVGHMAGVGSIDLSRATIRAAVERRLRAARVFTDDAGRGNQHRLFVNTFVFGPAFTVHVEYLKWLRDPFNTKGSGPAGTWRRVFHGLLGNDGDEAFIVSSVERVVEDFLRGYLRVNEKACAKVE